ncbi:YwmB family TATA-box binding protein [Bacillus sp. DNRA2]|uniref:YwmB family TATA-box binding protein n=1 Tax=Bacillus sp. DNRA2 TaxID=2723053 RepID=UPI00145EA608|nr:YwmB family TATA-box binding protein [Bacillus sp. DNRA2]NMD70097.1 YwmB family TATA-box binding protein [Bacillus sp. DNRA2]
MKQHINKVVILVIISIILVQFGNRPTEATKSSNSNAPEASDLITLAERLQGENIEIAEWSIHAREKLTSVKNSKDVENYIKSLREQFPTWDWTEASDKAHWEATAKSPDHSTLQESVKIVSTHTKQSTQAYVIYELKGPVWTKHTVNYLNTGLPSTFSNIFRNKPQIFSCVKAEIDDKMVSTLSLTKDGLLKAFNANEIESLSESSFISVTAASPLFAESLKRNQESINLQLALRTQGMGTKTTLVVGTPIITIEY